MTNSGRTLIVGTTTGLLLMGSCSTEPCACPPVLEGITLIAGNQQLGPVGQALANPIVVRADQLVPFEAGLAGRTVYFVPRPGAGSVSSSSAASDRDGLAQIVWTLGPDAGEDTLLVRLDSPDMDLGEAIVTATAQ